ncbi:hypothetical protein Hanom_Chr11g00976611 [Helianthus anomalus]
MPFSSMRFGQFCDFRPKVYFSASRSKRFEILPFLSGSLTPSIFLHQVGDISVFFVNLKGNSVFFRGIQSFLHKVKKTELPFKLTKKTKISLLLNGEKWVEVTSRMKTARFQTFWIQMQKNKPLDEIRKTG